VITLLATSQEHANHLIGALAIFFVGCFLAPVVGWFAEGLAPKHVFGVVLIWLLLVLGGCTAYANAA
jgi:uncharacterized membrane protein YedE/YeeE